MKNLQRKCIDNYTISYFYVKFSSRTYSTFFVDVDECREQPTYCQHRCMNTWGSFQCMCNEGYELATNGRSCRDNSRTRHLNDNNVATDTRNQAHENRDTESHNSEDQSKGEDQSQQQGTGCITNCPPGYFGGYGSPYYGLYGNWCPKGYRMSPGGQTCQGM